MSIYDNFADVPNQIRIEGQEITIVFARTSENTARISWNIPPPAQGCSAANRAYDGIVVTISNSPANYLTTSPKDGVYYEGDPTADYDIHSGSKIDKAYVVGAFYHDKTTTFIDITGILPKTPYYVSGYAVDAVGRYHREGVHAYSLPTGIQSYSVEDYPATHEIELASINPILPKTLTGLIDGIEYNLPIKMECRLYNIKINGSDARSYTNLISILNEKMAEITSPYIASVPPKAGDYYTENNIFYKWNGHRLIPIDVVAINNDPTTPINGTYWLNSGILYIYNNVWEQVDNIITSSEPPDILNSYDVWFDGNIVRVWEGNHWCDYNTIISDLNPQLPPQLIAGDYWYDTTNNEFFKWDEINKRWIPELVIYYEANPNDLNTGDYWYDENVNKIKQYVASSWNILSGVVYIDSDINNEYPSNHTSVAPGGFWYDTKNNKFYQRNLLNTEWIELQYVSYPKDPKIRESCDLWWNSASSINDLYVWEAVTNSWILVNNFYRQSIDPYICPTLPSKTAWVDTNGTITLITNQTCSVVNYINMENDPRNISNGSIWYDTDIEHYFIYNNGWEQIIYVNSENDPYDVYVGYYWYDVENNILYQYNSQNEWVQLCLYTNKNIYPKIDDEWYNNIDKILFKWNGSAWVPISPYIKVEFKQRTCLDNYDILLFSSRLIGCGETFEILDNNNTLFEALTTPIIYNDPIEGSDGVMPGPMYQQIGVGDDGSPDERRTLHEQIRMTFGHPAVRVELTKQQIDQCIDNALLVLRKESSYAYKKGMFFLDLKRRQQIYRLTNRCVGFNKIVRIISLHRIKAGAFRTAYSQNDNFAFAALQQLYTLGTFDMFTFHLTSSYIKELEILFASRIMFQWLERKRELKLYQLPLSRERVLVEALVEVPEQELLNDRETAYWIKRWAIVEAKGMLSQIRGKFTTLPGPNGSTQLNYNDLQTQMETEKTELLEQVRSKNMQDLTDIGMSAHFVIG